MSLLVNNVLLKILILKKFKQKKDKCQIYQKLKVEIVINYLFKIYRKYIQLEAWYTINLIGIEKEENFSIFEIG